MAILWLDGFLYYSVQSGGQEYGSSDPTKIAANPVFRTIPLEEAGSFFPGLKEMTRGFVDALRKGVGLRQRSAAPQTLSLPTSRDGGAEDRRRPGHKRDPRGGDDLVGGGGDIPPPDGPRVQPRDLRDRGRYG
ncbi:hypothetical protein P0O24_04505 [Methanotrichaceae archaeon M04Ac]|uniref:Uncharacterized protein n=1 Tax=Candidatus Methanocrinis alkalitolerans TaxID=3033395 RepID=A0ABT5XDV7_9EURY|nr:hypothetical protein [Candidatus Methanocrinis alkalitolerans]MDF0592840.1 hypothetical protein [Candidatus Methanocrinis alkalitolerans]